MPRLAPAPCTSPVRVQGGSKPQAGGQFVAEPSAVRQQSDLAPHFIVAIAGAISERQ